MLWRPTVGSLISGSICFCDTCGERFFGLITLVRKVALAVGVRKLALLRCSYRLDWLICCYYAFKKCLKPDPLGLLYALLPLKTVDGAYSS